MDDNFIVKKNKAESTVFAIRIDKELQERLDEIARISNRSRNQLINMALWYAVEKIKLEE